jgi:hypothetical protein
MCKHKNSEIRYSKRNEELEPVLYCYDCMALVNEYLPKYDHTFFTHEKIHDLEEFLANGTEEEKKEKVLSLTYGLKSILDHYTFCGCGYDENYTFIFGTFINEFKLLEQYFLKNKSQEIDPKDIKNHLTLFPKRLLEKLKLNNNKWTEIFRMKYNIFATNDYNKLENSNMNT